MLMINNMMFGAVIMASFTISLFFLKFWKNTRDRFFLYFAISFLLDGICRITLAATANANDYDPVVYTIRLISFLVIIYAIFEKNNARSKRK